MITKNKIHDAEHFRKISEKYRNDNTREAALENIKTVVMDRILEVAVFGYFEAKIPFSDFSYQSNVVILEDVYREMAEILRQHGYSCDTDGKTIAISWKNITDD